MQKHRELNPIHKFFVIFIFDNVYKYKYIQTIQYNTIDIRIKLACQNKNMVVTNNVYMSKLDI